LLISSKVRYHTFAALNFFINFLKLNNMNKIFSLSVAVVAFGIINVQAQSVDLGVKGGLTITNLTSGGSGTNTPVSEGYSSISTIGGGVFADFKCTNTFSLQVGLEFSRQGGQKNGVQALPAASLFWGQEVAAIKEYLPEDYIYADFKNKVRYNCLMLPVQAKFGWNLSQQSPFRVYVSAGVFGSYYILPDRVVKGSLPPFYAGNAKGTLSDWALANCPKLGAMPEPEQQMILGSINQFANTQQQVDCTRDLTLSSRSGNFGLIGAVGFSYQASPRAKIFVEAGGNYGLLKLQKENVYGQNRIGATSVMLGYAVSWY
jgi:hypothetical protein